MLICAKRNTGRTNQKLVRTRANSLKKTMRREKIEGKQRRKWQRKRWLDSITNSMDMNLSKLWEIVKNRKAWCGTISRVAKSQTWLSD